MALPAGISTATVTWGSFLDLFGGDAAAEVSVEPVLGGNARSIVWEASGQTLAGFAQTIKAPAGSPVTFVVPHVDQAGFRDGAGNAATMWAYRVNLSVRSGTGVLQLTKTFQPLVGQATIDLDLVPDGSITAPLSAPIPAVTSVNGQTGAVTVAGGGGGPITASQITDSTAVGRSVVTAADAAAVRTAVGAASTTHGHTIANVTDLQDELNGKADSGHAHTMSEVSGAGDLDNLCPGGVFAITWSGSAWTYSGATITSRPTSRTDVTMIAKSGTTAPAFAIAGDIWLEDEA